MKIFGFSFLRRLAPHYGPHYGVAAQGVLRGLGLIYVISFWSLAAQLIALSGANGLIPTNALLEFYQEQTGGWGPLWFPSLVWIYDNPLMLLGITGLGAITGITMLYGFFPWISAFISWICWVSLLQVCQPWMSTPERLPNGRGWLMVFATHLTESTQLSISQCNGISDYRYFTSQWRIS